MRAGARLRPARPRTQRQGPPCATRPRASTRPATAPAANSPSNAGQCDKAGRRSVAVARLWARFSSWSPCDPPAVEATGRRLRGRVKVPVPAPGRAVEHAAGATSHLRMLDGTLLHVMLGLLTSESSLHNWDLTSQSSG